MIKAILTVGGFTAISRVTGLIREILFSYFLGASALTDAFFFAFKFPNFFRRLFAEGAFSAAFVPFFAGQLAEDGKDTAKKTAEQVFAVLACFLFVFVVLVVCFAPWIVHTLAAGFDDNRADLAITFIRITFPYILFISLAAHLTGVLNSLDRFVAGAAVPILLNILMIAALVMVPIFPAINPGMLLSCSVFMAGIAQFLWLYRCAARAGFSIRLVRPRITPAIKKLIRLMGPGIIGAGVMNINFFIDTIIASFLPEKSLSYIYYADRLNQLPLSIFGIAIGTALLPTLSRQLRQGELDTANKSQSLAIEFALSLSLPSMVGLALFAHPLIQLIYHLPAIDTLATAHALSAFALGIPAYVLTKILSVNFFAHQDTKTPVIIGVTCIFANILLNVFLMHSLQHVALALSTSLAAWLNATLLYTVLHRRHFYRLPFWVIQRSVKIIVSCCAMGVFLIVVQNMISVGASLSARLLYVFGTIFVAICIFIGLGFALQAFNIPLLKRILRNRKSVAKKE